MISGGIISGGDPTVTPAASAPAQALTYPTLPIPAVPQLPQPAAATAPTGADVKVNLTGPEGAAYAKQEQIDAQAYRMDSLQATKSGFADILKAYNLTGERIYIGGLVSSAFGFLSGAFKDVIQGIMGNNAIAAQKTVELDKGKTARAVSTDQVTMTDRLATTKETQDKLLYGRDGSQERLAQINSHTAMAKAEIHEKGLTDRAALGNIDDIFGMDSRESYNNGNPFDRMG